MSVLSLEILGIDAILVVALIAALSCLAYLVWLTLGERRALRAGRTAAKTASKAYGRAWHVLVGQRTRLCATAAGDTSRPSFRRRALDGARRRNAT